VYLLSGGEEVWVIAALLQVHHDVEERDGVTTLDVQRGEVACQDVLVVLPGNHTKISGFKCLVIFIAGTKNHTRPVIHYQ